MSPAIRSINTGRVVAQHGSRLGRSGIDKKPASGPVRVHALGVDGDEIADLHFHGGIDQAVYAYAQEDLDRWAVILERDLTPGQFGENLTTVGIDLSACVIGERWRIGEVMLEVSCPRIPCNTFQAFLAERGWVKRFTADANPGAYLRVLTDGYLSTGEPIEVVSRPDHGVTIGLTFRARSSERHLLPELLAAPELPAEWRDRARAYLADPASAD